MIVVDGSHGEGGGQVLRTSLTLAMLTGRAVRIQRIRAGRPKPGLAAQHLTSVRAAAAICDADVTGDDLGSKRLEFRPGGPPQAGDYVFDVAQARQGGSAGSVGLVLQTVLLPLGLAAGGASRLTLRGGTHVAWSPSFTYLNEVYLPVLAQLGLPATAGLQRWGFYPAGGGEVEVQIPGRAPGIRPLSLMERGPLRRVWGTAVVTNLPAHIPQRMANRARNLLAAEDLQADVQARRERANGPGAGIFLLAEYEGGARAGFTAYGRKGLPAEQVAEAACRDLLAHYRSGAPVDKHLADQLILPLALADDVSQFTTCQATEHLRTNMWVMEQFARASFAVEPARPGGQTVTVFPRARDR